MKKTIYVVGAILENQNGEIFCAMRPVDKTFPGLWEFPGGKIEDGEDPKEALRREIEEELNISIKVGELFDVVEKEYEKFIINLTTYSCDILDFTDFELVEHQEFKWLKREELQNLEWVPTDIPTLEKLVKSEKELKNISIFKVDKGALSTKEIEVLVRPKSLILNVIAFGEWNKEVVKTREELEEKLDSYGVSKTSKEAVCKKLNQLNSRI
ncbi:(deoxy)nucleoside triphosphate pyrophosphohydrolase [Cetobacterium sp. ZWU0022]|uniref:(deoxy)nucleoside triphosphate pyrophosphohydrolase n=1 Tax=Cetobacterium sp. ZWU0022 TaxID=1340502 RepID=UPI0009DCA023|nr:(deoxy)nucleoside triphosphate pyrophosphohydrolase [Cetobacterium sp. ZWU0022]